MNFHTLRPLLTALSLTTFALSPICLAAARSEEPPAPPVTRGEGSARKILEIGMTGEQVLQLVGKPSAIKPMKNAEVKAEVWLYSYDKMAGVKQVATSMRDVPYVDPITGIQKMIQEPVYSQEMTYLVETTELLMVDGKLAHSKRYRRVKRDFN